MDIGETPRTIAGLALQASLVKDFPGAQRFNEQLNGGKPGWNNDEPAVMEAACELATRRLFRPGYDVREVTSFVAGLTERVPESRMRGGHLEVEAVIRAALGEKDTALDGIRPVALYSIRNIVVMEIIYRLNLTQQEISQLVVDAENATFARGWQPPLAKVV